jgi:hypothetical protein
MSPRGGMPVQVFEVSGDAALAWYFVMAHWPDAETAPELRFSTHRLDVPRMRDEAPVNSA